jgi:hypothetical protein
MSINSPGHSVDTGWIFPQKRRWSDKKLKKVQENKLKKKTEASIPSPHDQDQSGESEIEVDSSLRSSKMQKGLPTDDHNYVKSVELVDDTEHCLSGVQLFNDYSKYYSPDSEEPFIVHVENKPGESGNVGRMHPLTLGKKLFEGKIKGIKEVKHSNRNRVVCTFDSASTANQFVCSNFANDNNSIVYIPSYQLERVGLIRYVDISLSEDEILTNLQNSNGIKIVSVKRITKVIIDSEGQKSVKPTSLVSIKFQGKRLPDYVFLFYNRCPVEPYVSNPIICFKCIRFGHTSKNCKSSLRCPNCSCQHDKQSCDRADNPKCLFCGGPHSSLDRSCPEYGIQKQIKECMAYRNMSYQEAKTFMCPTLPQPKSPPSTTLQNYDISFPQLPKANISIPREKLTIPTQNRPGKKLFNATVKSKHTVPSLSKDNRSASIPPKYTHQYYKNLVVKDVCPSNPVFTYKNKSQSDSSGSIDENPVDMIMNVLSLVKKNEMPFDIALSKLLKTHVLLEKIPPLPEDDDDNDANIE